jgi:hypothetical protein
MTDFTLSITDQDALDAIDHIIQVNETGEKPSDVIAGMIVPQLVAMREQQLVNAAQAKAQDDPDLVAFRAKKQAKIEAESAAAAKVAEP